MKNRHRGLCMAGSIALAFLWTTAWAAPSIHFPETEWNWGEVYSGDKIVRTFIFQNKGDETLKILDISTSCGCTAALTTDKNLPPGGEGKIEVTFDTRGYRGRSLKVVYVNTNDPATPKAQLKIQGNIKMDLLLRPNNIYMGFRDRDQVHSRDIELTNDGQKPIQVLDIISENPEVSVGIQVPQTIEPGAKLKVPLKLKLPEKGDRFVGQIVLHTDHPRHREEVIPVRLQVMLPVPGKAMESSPFLEQLRKFKEQREKRKKLKEETPQTPETPQ